MTSKSIIAHELGHAVLMHMDNEFKATKISLKEEDGNWASCDCKKIKGGKGNTVNLEVSKLHGISDLGGIFGELVFCGKWNPWGCRLDLDDFTSNNCTSKSKIVNEAFEWLWNDSDKLSFFNFLKKKSRYKKSVSYFTEKQTEKRLSNMWSAYQSFASKINPTEFRYIVNEIYEKEKEEIRHNTIQKYIKRVVK